MTSTYIIYEGDTIGLDNLPDPEPNNPVRLKNVTPLTERLWKIALNYIESNIIETEDGLYLTSGAKWGKRVYTRDIAYEGIFGLNQLYPEVIWESLKYTRKLRRRLGFSISTDYDHWLDSIDMEWKQINLTEKEILNKYHTNCYHKRTDDVVWLWCAFDWLQKNKAEFDDWQWVYTEGNYFFDNFYWPFYDSTDGLFRGQSSYIDIGWGYPLHWDRNQCILVKATSTNCLYYKAMQSMSEIAEHLGLNKESDSWREKAEALKENIREQLIRSDGSISYYKDMYGKLSDRQHTLATAFPVLFGIVTGEEAKRAYQNYPVTDAGVPVIYPFFPNNPGSSKYRSTLFATTFFLKAKEIATGEDYTALNAALLARSCNPEGYFHDYIHFSSKEPLSEAGWTAAAFIDVCKRRGLVDFK
jgi:hypothetical protein